MISPYRFALAIPLVLASASSCSASGTSSTLASNANGNSGTSTGTGTNPDSCTFSGDGSQTAGSGELTCYFFGQGTYQGTCLGATTYKTNCGYCGSEESSSGSACSPEHNDTVANISTGPYYAAVPDFANGETCGMCLSITYGDKTIVATVVDNCATCGAGHIDLNPTAGAALGMGNGMTEDATIGVSWKTVACPVTSSIVVVANGVYSGQLYFQNVAFPVKSASAVIFGQTATAALNNGMWDFGQGVPAGAEITLTDLAGHTVTGTMPATNGGSLGTQFPTTC